MTAADASFVSLFFAGLVLLTLANSASAKDKLAKDSNQGLLYVVVEFDKNGNHKVLEDGRKK